MPSAMTSPPQFSIYPPRSALTCSSLARHNAAPSPHCCAAMSSLKSQNICPTPFSCLSTAESICRPFLLALFAPPVHFALRDCGDMTHDVLQSDIDLARKLSDARRPASEIVTALTCRGIDSSRAAQLVSDLQNGRTIEPDKPITINLARKSTAETVTLAPQ